MKPACAIVKLFSVVIVYGVYGGEWRGAIGQFIVAILFCWE